MLGGSIILFRSLAAPGPGRRADAGPGGDRAVPAADQGPAAGAPLSTAQLVARCEPSVALIKGKVSSGTGFLVRPGLIATNAHVIDDEFLPDLEVRFPSAADGLRGPIRAELLYEDPRRDLAFLAIRSACPRWKCRGRTGSSRARTSP